MHNGYFQVVESQDCVALKLFPPTDSGEPLSLAEIASYLDKNLIPYEMEGIKMAIASQKEAIVPLSTGECPAIDENYILTISEDKLQAKVRFYPPSETGSRLSMNELLNDLKYKNVVFGIQIQAIQNHINSNDDYCRDIIIAQGEPPVNGKDAYIKYYFNTELHIQPTMREDGTVDYFNLNMINHCKKGDVLARMIPADPGVNGTNVCGNAIRPKDVKKVSFSYSNNIDISEDKLTLTSAVNGHVVLVEGKIFVSDVYEVENVDNSIGNIDYDGSVQVNGNVASNFTVKAKGNVVVKGVVEGAIIEAGGNIVIARGMNGMSKGSLKAGGDIIVKFLENAAANAAGYVQAESILHSNVQAGTELIVTGKKGFVTGGHVQAAERVTVKTLGSNLGASTIVEVGCDPALKVEFMQLQKDIAAAVKSIRSNQPVLASFAEKKAKGANFSLDQTMYIRNIAKEIEEKKTSLKKMNERMQILQKSFNPDAKSEVIVTGVVYPGATIIINDVSMIVQSSYKYCRFEKREGDVKMAPL